MIAADVAARAHLAADVEAVHVGQAEVEDHDRRSAPDERSRAPSAPTRHAVDLVALTLEGAHEGDGDVFLVLDDEHVVGHGESIGGGPGPRSATLETSTQSSGASAGGTAPRTDCDGAPRARSTSTGHPARRSGEQVAELRDPAQHLVEAQLLERQRSSSAPSSTSSQVSGAATVGRSRPRREYGETVVLEPAFCDQSRNTLPRPLGLGHHARDQRRGARLLQLLGDLLGQRGRAVASGAQPCGRSA